MELRDKKYTSVLDMIKDLGSPEFYEEFKKYLNSKKVTKNLVLRRIMAELTAEDFAARAGVPVEYIYRLELSNDSDLTLLDVLVYSKTIDFTLSDFFKKLEM